MPMRVLRLSLMALGLAALCWGVNVLPALRAGGGFGGIASRIIAGEPFRAEVLDRQITYVAALPAVPVSYARMQGAAPILQLRALEMAFDTANVTGLDARMDTLSAALRNAARFSPSDPLLWNFMFWLESMREGLTARTRGYLQLSYALGPLEGYVALRRNRLGLANFNDLDGATQDNIVAEFAGMLDAKFMDAVVSNLMAPGWPQRDRLLVGLDKVDLAAKQEMVKMFQLEGVRLAIPGMAELEERPWRR